MMSLEGVPAFYIHSLFGTENDYALYQKTGHNRSLNRGKIDYNKINTESTNTKESKIYNKLRELLLLRRNQAAFHPNALQFTLHLGNELYGIWRQSIDKTQSIFCITNITEEIVTLSLLDIAWASLFFNKIDNKLEIVDLRYLLSTTRSTPP